MGQLARSVRLTADPMPVSEEPKLRPIVAQRELVLIHGGLGDDIAHSIRGDLMAPVYSNRRS